MKNELKTRIKKMAAVGMAVMLTAGPMAAPVFAASPDAVLGVSGKQAGVDGLTGNVTVSGIQTKDKDKVTVTAYQVVDGVYKDNKLVKYVLVDPTNAPIAAIGNQDKGQAEGHNDIITEAELTKIADNIQTKAFTADSGTKLTSTDGTTYTGSLEPGMYVVLVTGATDTVYNPAVVSVNLSDANADAGKDIKAGSVDLSKFFQTYDGSKDTDVYVKSSLSDMDKNITGSQKSANVSEEDQKFTPDSKIDPKNKDEKGNSKGDTVAYGDTVFFKLDGMTVPSFSTDYKDPVYKITDTLENNSFSGITNLKIKVNEKDAVKDTDYTITETDGKTTFTDGTSKSFQIVFTKGFLDAHKADATRPTVEITYNAKLQETAGLNYAENLNHAEISYSNNPNDEKSFKTIKKNTYHYTFGIDAALDGEDSTGNQETHEFNKVTKASADSGKDYVDGTGVSTQVTTKKSKTPLAGATFTLYSDEACTIPVKKGEGNYTATSDTNGHFSFVGLDEGTYYVKETTAPAKYTLSPNVYKFVIAADLDAATGIMKNYSVMTSVKDTSIDRGDWKTAGSATYTNTISDDATASAKTGDGQITNNIASTVTPMEVVDVKLQTLPSTGAAGTLGLTAAAAAGMAIFFTLSRNGKKKEEKKAN